MNMNRRAGGGGGGGGGGKGGKNKPLPPAAAGGYTPQFIGTRKGKKDDGSIMLPQISPGPILGPQDIQQQINSQRAYTDMSTQNRISDMRGSAAARGFGQQSPMIAALQGQYENAGLASNVENERLTRMQSAMENAKHRLDAETARERELTGRLSGRNTILQALAGLV
jgi:hypothetical protein